jgi:hypothetical protein
MGLKFRRGTTAQQSGSLAFGEPYVNTTLGTLVIGGDAGDIVLSSTGTGSTGTFGAISGSGLDITGNANVGGNLTIGGQVTIGDNTSDSVNVVASLSSSLIPQTTNVFDLGSATKIWKDLYISTGSIKFVDPGNGTVVGTLSSNANGDFKVAGEISGSTINGLGNATLYSTSVNSRLAAAESFSSSLDSTFATDASVTSLSSSVKAVTDTFATSASVASATATSISTLSGSVKTVTDALSGRVTTLEGTDISITLTGDVTGTGTITNLANVSFATTIAANSVALGTDTTGDYVASMTAGTGITVGTATGEGSTPVITNTGVTSVSAGTGITLGNTTGACSIAIGQAVATSSNVQFNSLGIGMAATGTAGRIDAANDIVAFSSSDIRFKENIKAIENPIEKIRKISGNTYDWKEENKIEHGYEGNDVGVIAQEIEAVLPQLVQTRENGYKAVKYDKLVALLIEGIKAQQNQIDSLTIEIENLKKNNSL